MAHDHAVWFGSLQGPPFPQSHRKSGTDMAAGQSTIEKACIEAQQGSTISIHCAHPGHVMHTS
jgi:hypothetical protein